MINKMSEELQVFTVVPPQVLSGASVTYNGNAIGGTGLFSSPTNVGYLDSRGFSKAQVNVSLGQVTGTGTGTVSLVAAPIGTVGATGSAGSTGANGFSIAFTTADDNTLKIGEVDLSKLPGGQWWVKLDHPSTLVSNIAISVTLGNPDKVPVSQTVTSEFNG